MARKGRLDEILSKALYADDASLYVIGYRDFDTIAQVALPEFMKLSENFAVIPRSRIAFVKKGDQLLYRKHGFSIQ